MELNYSGNAGESLNIDAKITSEQQLKRMAGDLGNDVSGQTGDRFSQEAFQIAACVCDFIESALNAFTKGIQPQVEFFRDSG